MGCNGSKQQQDVAAGNTVTRLLRRKSGVTEGTLSSTSPKATTTATATHVAAIDEDSSNHVDDLPATEKAVRESPVVDDVEETKQNPSCSDHANGGSEAAEVDVHATDAPHDVDHAGETAVATGSEDEVSDAKVEENVELAAKEHASSSIKDGDGQSTGKHFMDSKEAITFEEAEETKGIHASKTDDTNVNELIAKGTLID